MWKDFKDIVSEKKQIEKWYYQYDLIYVKNNTIKCVNTLEKFWKDTYQTETLVASGEGRENQGETIMLILLEFL